MRARVLVVWAAMAAFVVWARLGGLIRVGFGQVAFQFPRRSIYTLALSPTIPLLAVAWVLLTAAAFAPTLRRALAKAAGRVSSRLPAALLLFLLGLSAWDARERWGCWFAAPLTAGLLAAAAAFSPRRVRFRVAWRVKRASRWLRAFSVRGGAWLVGAVSLPVLLAIRFLLYQNIPYTGDGASALFEAHLMAMGRLKLPSPEFPEFFMGTGIIVDNGWYSMYPPGHSLLLAAGVFLHVPWLVGALSGAATAALVYSVGARWFGKRCGALAALLLMTSPQWLAMSPSCMSHTTASLWLAVALAALCWSEGGHSTRNGGLGGLAIGLACATRPATGLAVGAPLAVAFWARQWKRPNGRRAILAAALALAAVGVLGLLYNWGTTGDPFELGYRHAGAYPRLGFGAPNGHTPLKGLFQTLNNLWALSAWGAGTFPGLYVFLALWWLLGPFGWRERTLAACWVALPFVYFFYYYQDYCIGPRLLYESGPAGALLAARGVEALFARLAAAAPPGARHRLGARAFTACAAALAIGAIPSDLNWLDRISGIHAGNVALMQGCRQFESDPKAVVFIYDFRQAITVAENLRHPDGPLFLKGQGKTRDGQFVAAHPDRRYWLITGGTTVSYEEALKGSQEANATD
ncbi:MAG: glycosyltransferase family 39 protein [Candidatus Sumerlaeota bacterium]|nr:glycosyltransferase family 39 protein [Candidatus Sumerlaeota bacterium]